MVLYSNFTLLLLIPKLLNIPIACCSLINLDFLLPHIAQFDCIINLFCLFLTILGLLFLVYFLHKFLFSSFISACNYFKHYQNFISACNYFKHYQNFISACNYFKH